MARSIIAYNCDPKGTYHFNKGELKTVGHLVNLSFKTGGKMNADVLVDDPLNPGTKVPVVGVVNEISWPSDAREPVFLSVRVSKETQPLIIDALHSADGSTEMTAEWVIYKYDSTSNRYNKAFHTDGKEIECVRTMNAPATVDNDRDPYLQEPENYIVQLSLTGSKEQELIHSTKFGNNTSKQFGIDG